MITGKTTIFQKGKLSTAVRASISVPTLFKAFQFKNKLLVDGGISNPVPDDIVKKMGADIVISVNLDNYIKNEKFNEKNNKKLSSITQRSLKYFCVLIYLLLNYNSDFIIEPHNTCGRY